MTWRESRQIWFAFGLLFGFEVFGFWMILPAAQIPTKVLFRGEDVMLTVGELRPNLPRVFAIPLESGHATEFFVDAGTGDTLTVALASCRKCYRAGHYRQGGYILCGECKDLMERSASGQRIPPEKDCTQVPIPFEVLAIVSRSGRTQ